MLDKPSRGMLRADFEQTAARMRKRNLRTGSGCRSTARAIEMRQNREIQLAALRRLQVRDRLMRETEGE